MDKTLKDRLLQFIKNKGIKSVRGLEKELGLSNSTISGIGNNPRQATVSVLATHFPDLNIGWLMTGEGEMIKNGMQNEKKMKKAENITQVELDHKIMYVPLISKYAHAGFLNGYDDTEYIENLPTIPFFVDHMGKGNYLAFEVKGDSMDDGTTASLIEGDILLVREITNDLWTTRLHITKWNFVIAHRTEGLIVKRITAHNIEQGIITIHSLNPDYPDQELFLGDIAHIFNVIKIERKPTL